MSAAPREVVKDIAELISIPSVSSSDPALDMSNEPVLQRLEDMLGRAGFRCEWLPVEDAPGKYNLVGTKGKGTGGLVLSGHSDTVPFDAQSWSSDPFTLDERNGRLYGLGSADMKSFLALAAAAAAEYAVKDLERALIVVATADEETGMSGARSLASGSGKLADVALIGEPTSLKPVRMHKGILAERIMLDGRSGHSSDPSLGVSALDGMREVLNGLSRLRESLQETTNPAFHVPFPTMNFGRVQGGDNPNRICASCTLDIDCRFLPGMKLAAVRRRIHDTVRQSVAGSGLAVRFQPLFYGTEPMDTPADSAFVRTVEKLTGSEAGGVAFATEAPFFGSMGTEVVVAGPGSIDQAHQPDEYIELSSIPPTLKLLDRLIGTYCAGG
jgi:acetylornithine deacetylase